MSTETAKWYVLHTRSGYEALVKSGLERLIENNNLEEVISEIPVVTDWGNYKVGLHPFNSAYKTLPNNYDDEKMRLKKNQITIITGIELYNAILTILDVYDGDHGKRQTTCNYSMKIEERAGVGEIFDAMFFETSTNGFSLVDALSASTSFINNSLRFSRDNKLDINEGIMFEPILHDNVEAMKQRLIELKKNNQNNQNNNKGE